MLYQEIVEEEMAIMDEETPDEPSKTLSPHEIHVPLHSLMYPPVTVDSRKEHTRSDRSNARQ